MAGNNRYIRVKFEDTRNKLLKFLLGNEIAKPIISEYIFKKRLKAWTNFLNSKYTLFQRDIMQKVKNYSKVLGFIGGSLGIV